MPNLMGQIRMIEMIDFSERTFHKRLSKAIVARGLRSGSMFSSSATKTEESPANPPPRVDSPSDIAPGESLSLPNAPWSTAHRCSGVAHAAERPPMAVEGRAKPMLVAGRRLAPANFHPNDFEKNGVMGCRWNGKTSP